MKLAFEIAARFHGADEAQKAVEEFDQIFKNKNLPTDIEEVILPSSKEETSLVDLLAKLELVSSKTDARRMIQQNAVTMNDEKITSVDKKLVQTGEYLLKVGKRRFKKVKFTS